MGERVMAYSPQSSIARSSAQISSEPLNKLGLSGLASTQLRQRLLRDETAATHGLCRTQQVKAAVAASIKITKGFFNEFLLRSGCHHSMTLLSGMATAALLLILKPVFAMRHGT